MQTTPCPTISLTFVALLETTSESIIILSALAETGGCGPERGGAIGATERALAQARRDMRKLLAEAKNCGVLPDSISLERPLTSASEGELAHWLALLQSKSRNAVLA